MGKTFNLGGYLESKGMAFSRVGEDGKYYVNTPDGEEKAFDVQGFMKARGLEKTDFRLNSPDSAIDESPVSLADRAKLSLDNTPSQIKYYKSKFEDAAFHEGNGVVVKDKGVWKKVDSSSMDPWELTKDVVEGGLSLAPSLIGGTAGAIGGAAAGALTPVPGGAAVGGVVGSGLGAGAARALLGRLLGTSARNPEEELKEVGWETLLNAGGQGLALGVKPAMSAFVAAGKSLKAIPDASKGALAEVIGRTTGAGPQATSTFFEESGQVAKDITKSMQKYGSEQAAVEGLTREGISTVEQMVERAPQALSKKFRNTVTALAESAPKDFKVNLSDVGTEASKTLENLGLGKVVTGAEDKNVLELLSNKESLKRIAQGQEGSLLDDESATAISKMFNVLNDVSKAPVASGKNAVNALMELNRTINQTARAVASRNADPTVRHFVNQVRQAVSLNIGQKFANAGMHDGFKATSELYERFADSVNYARKTMQETSGAELLHRRLTAGIGKSFSYKDLAGDMAELLGDEGKEMLKTIAIKDAASKFVPTLPKVTFGSLSAAGLGTAALASGTIAPGIGLAGAALASPRLVGKGIEATQRAFAYGKQASDFIAKMSPSMRTKWLSSPEAVDTTIRTTLDGLVNEEKQTDGLLQSQGVK